MSEYLQVWTTLPDEVQARALATDLVQRRLAACVQVGGPVESIYRWQGNVETSREWTCAIKARRDLYPAIERAIREQHPYDTPQIIALPILLGWQPYLDWLLAETRPDEPARGADF